MYLYDQWSILLYFGHFEQSHKYDYIYMYMGNMFLCNELENEKDWIKKGTSNCDGYWKSQ